MKRDEQPVTDAPPAAVETREATLDELLPEVRRSPRRSTSSLIGECIDDRHPTLQGRVRVRWDDGEGVCERWCPTLQGLPVRIADRVLMVRPQNGDAYVVTGVVDGFAKRPEVDAKDGARLELKRDEAVRIAGTDGRELVEVRQGETGPVVTLLHDDLDLRVPGRLRMRAQEVSLHAEQGRAEVTATDDVIVKGEMVRLN